MTPISAIGKYLDQPILTAKINKNVPTMLTIGGSAILLKEISNAPKEKRKQVGIKTSIVLAVTALSAAKAPKIASKIAKRKGTRSLNQIFEDNTKIIDDFLSKNNIDKKYELLLQEAKTRILSLKEISELYGASDVKSLMNKLIPPPDNISANDIFKEIGWLSIYGAIPVLGGIAGGVLADKLTEKSWKDKIPNKVNEGIYQYFANIFMCNIGAGAALATLEKFNIRSKTARCIGMVGGIILTGIVGGSVIANFIGNKIINPLMKKEYKSDYRTPELIDLSLHTDDIATVSLLSGLKWIEPSLPLLYSISGYRAGIGYRNSEKVNARHIKKTHFLRQEC